MKGNLGLIALHQVFLIAFCLVWHVFGEAQGEGNEGSNNDKNCTCMPIHPHQAYCNADFVFRARIHEELSLKTKRDKETPDLHHRIMVPRYRIQISTIWKGRALVVDAAENDNANSKVIGLDQINTVLYTDSSPCGLTSLERGRKYILSGNVMRGKLSMTTCNWHLQWDSRSKKIRRQLRKGDFHCRCIVEPCFSQSCVPRDNLTCVWKVKFQPLECKFRACRYQAGGCRWTNKFEMNVCENKRRVYRLKSP